MSSNHPVQIPLLEKALAAPEGITATLKTMSTKRPSRSMEAAEYGLGASLGRCSSNASAGGLQVGKARSTSRRQRP